MCKSYSSKLSELDKEWQQVTVSHFCIRWFTKGSAFHLGPFIASHLLLTHPYLTEAFTEDVTTWLKNLFERDITYWSLFMKVILSIETCFWKWHYLLNPFFKVILSTEAFFLSDTTLWSHFWKWHYLQKFLLKETVPTEAFSESDTTYSGLFYNWHYLADTFFFSKAGTD